MRLAVISDIHGNLTALEAVISDLDKTSPDLVIHAGDLAANGCRPAQVIDQIRELGCQGVQGNTDEMLWVPERLAELERRAPKIKNLLHILFNSIAPVTREMIGEERINWLRALPLEWHCETLLVLHASPGDLWQAPMPDCGDAQLIETYGGCRAAIIVYGHIHRPYIRLLPELTVANCGSVGLPYDGDRRASYILVEDGRPTVRRVQYDVESEIKYLLASNYPCADWLAAILREGRYTPPFK